MQFYIMWTLVGAAAVLVMRFAVSDLERASESR